MQLPTPPISIENEAVTRGKQTIKPGDSIKSGTKKGKYKQLVTDRSGGVYMQCIIDGRSYYKRCTEVQLA